MIQQLEIIYRYDDYDIKCSTNEDPLFSTIKTLSEVFKNDLIPVLMNMYDLDDKDESVQAFMKSKSINQKDVKNRGNHNGHNLKPVYYKVRECQEQSRLIFDMVNYISAEIFNKNKSKNYQDGSIFGIASSRIIQILIPISNTFPTQHITMRNKK